MATKKFIIEVEEGMTKCGQCPDGFPCGGLSFLHCCDYNLATMKITEYNEGEALLYAVTKTAERTKRETIAKAVEWLRLNMHNYAANISYSNLLDSFNKAMQNDTSQRL